MYRFSNSVPKDNEYKSTFWQPILGVPYQKHAFLCEFYIRMNLILVDT